jgi:peptide/nickel transport system permease protein
LSTRKSVPGLSALATLLPSEHRREKWLRSWKRFINQPLSGIGLAIVIVVVFCTVFAPVIAPHPEHAGKVINYEDKLESPSLSHPMGTDFAGRDILSRVMFGYRLSLTLAAVVLGISVPIGIVLGLVAGYYGGRVDWAIMRFTDTFLALPPLVMALVITSTLEPTMINAMIAISALWWTWHARLVRSVVTGEKNEEYVSAAKLAGASDVHIMFREILPNALSPILVKVTLDAGLIIVIGAGLSFMGIGVQPPRPGLGTMVANGTTYMPDSWWYTIFPGLAILVLVLGFNMIGDGLRDVFDVEVNR